MRKQTPIETYVAARARREQREKAARFAKAMTRAVFGRAYVEDTDISEVRRSIARRHVSPAKKA